MRVRIDSDSRSFIRDGKHFFYQADTLWMAFSKLTPGEWEEILRVRRDQRFTVLQLSVLPIVHDNSQDEQALMPFVIGSDGAWDFDTINEAYFDRACELLALAVKYGFVPCLHLLWVNYVPDTWAAKLAPETVMPLAAVEKYLRYLLPRLLPYEALYSISGDTGFETDEVVRYYLKAMEIVREMDPDGLITLHLTPHADVPDAIVHSGMLDFYSYQAGHGYSNGEKDNSVIYARHYWKKSGAKPVVNSEPPYDGHSYGREYGRFGAFDVRRSLWQSLLSGAHAGITYGAHGMWGMHKQGQFFNHLSFSGMPFAWRTALHLDGAWEPGFARFLFDRYDLYDLVPMDKVLSNSLYIPMAGKRDLSVLLIYVPYPADVELDLSLEEYNILAMDMAHKRCLAASASFADDRTTLHMPQYNTDILYIAIFDVSYKEPQSNAAGN